MTDYSELVKALRCANRYKNFTKDCDSQNPNEPCRYCHHWLCEDDRIFEDAAAAIEELQAEVPKRGEWIEENRRPRSSQFVCSECHRTAYDPQPTRDKAWRKRCRYAYCPNCGAKMTGEQDVE